MKGLESQQTRTLKSTTIKRLALTTISAAKSEKPLIKSLFSFGCDSKLGCVFDGVRRQQKLNFYTDSSIFASGPREARETTVRRKKFR